MKTEFLVLSFFSLLSFSSANPTERDWNLLRSNDSLDLFLNDQYVGTLSQSITVQDKARQITLERRLAVGGAGRSDPAAPNMNMLEQRRYGFNGVLSGARQELASAAGSSAWELRRAPGGAWKLAQTTGGKEQERPLDRVTENLNMTYALYKGIRDRALKPGTVLYDTSFDLTTAREIATTVACKEAPSPANGGVWVFTERDNALDRDERWTMDTGGATVYEELYPFVCRKKGTARGGTKAASLFSIVEALSVPVQRPATNNERIALVLDTGVAPDSSVRAMYRAQGPAWVVVPPAAFCPDTGAALLNKEDRQKFMAATPTMQCDDARIKKLANGLVAGKRSRCDTIRALYEYVFQKLEKRYTPTFSNAIETLEAGYGDCGEHAVLLGALLRAAGVPARVVLGLVYVEGKKGYYYHAWVLAYGRGGWLWADPALGVFPAARDRVPLVLDDTGENIFSIAKIIGRVKIEYRR